MNWRKIRLLALGMLAQAVQAADVASPSVAQGGAGPAAGGVFSVLFGLIAVIAMIVGLAWMARRVGVARPQDNALIQVIGAASLGSRERVAGRRLPCRGHAAGHPAQGKHRPAARLCLTGRVRRPAEIHAGCQNKTCLVQSRVWRQLILRRPTGNKPSRIPAPFVRPPS
jgi:hypothetical protein